VRGPDGRELLIPLAEAVCTRINPEGKLIVVEPPEALLDLNP
jgi:ribosomal 30S subunit maturation factor RimM